MQVIDKVCNILALLSDGNDRTVSEIAEAVDLTLPTAHRILATLTARGMLEKDGKTKRYSLGWMLVRYAKSVRETSEERYMVQLIAPLMREASDKIGETVSLAAVVGNKAVLVAVEEGASALRFYSELGQDMPWHASAPAKLLLAWQPENMAKSILRGLKYQRFTDRTIGDEETLKGELAEIRRVGVSYCLGELEPFCAAAAVPVFDERGGVPLSLSAVGHDFRMEQNMEQIVASLREAAARAGTVIAQNGFTGGGGKTKKQRDRTHV